MKGKKRLFSLIFAVLAVMFTVSGTARAQRIGVVSFENKSGAINREFGSIVADVLVSEFMQYGDLEVIERAQLDKLAGEIKLCAQGMTTECVGELGKIQGLDYIVTGTVLVARSSETFQASIYKSDETVRFNTNISDVAGISYVTVSVNLRMVDVKTARIVFSDDSKGTTFAVGNSKVNDINYFEAISETLKNTVVRIALNMGIIPRASVVRIRYDAKGNKIESLIIDRGRNHGYDKGHEYTIVREGEVVYDPVTGKRMGAETLVIATFEVERIEANTAYSSDKKIKREKNAPKIMVGDRLGARILR